MTRTVAALSVLMLLACDSGETDTCASLAVEYRAALDQAAVCDPSAANACIGHGATVAVRVEEDGRQVLEGLCTNCPAGVNAARTSELDAILARYAARGCAGACPCPTGRLDPGWAPQCTPTAGGTGTCDP